MHLYVLNNDYNVKKGLKSTYNTTITEVKYNNNPSY